MQRRFKEEKTPENKKKIELITYPPQLLPHLQPDPHPQFPPQQDIILRIFLEKLQEI